MIPKIIHYCWFGEKPIPKGYIKNIKSWQKYMPDYEIKQWNESNFDVNCIPFSKEAYEVGKFAYVSDYARLKILYEYGGIYFDTDVEVIRSLEKIINQGPWMGVEKHDKSNDNSDYVSLGLGFAVEPHNPIIKEIMSVYENTHYIFPDGHIQQVTIVIIATNVFRKYGMPISIDTPTLVAGIMIYPWKYFCPKAFLENKIEITENTYTIHHYSASWMSFVDKLKMRRGYYANKLRYYLKRK